MPGVVSLVPSVTETLLAWGISPAACTRFCEQPQLRHVGGTKDPDIAAIVALTPDLVVLDREENRREDAEALTSAGVTTHITHVTSIRGVASMMADLAAAVGLTFTPGADLGNDPPVWATSLTLIWRRPWMTINQSTYGSSLLRHIGVANVTEAFDDVYPTIELEDWATQPPTLVILPSEPYPFASRHVDEVAALVPGAIPVLVDGRDLFWWGARTPAALERLRAALHAAMPPW
jgi:ABC-type Fe3+-hydroxamate transport system substrate-binding protein